MVKEASPSLSPRATRAQDGAAWGSRIATSGGSGSGPGAKAARTATSWSANAWSAERSRAR